MCCKRNTRQLATFWGNIKAMNRRTLNLLKQHQHDINRINQQRRWWLYASSVVFLAVVFLIFAWDWIDGLHSHSIWWVVVSSALIISVNWWYWTMKVIKRILEHQEIEYNLLFSIIDDLHSVRNDIKFLDPKNVDNLK